MTSASTVRNYTEECIKHRMSRREHDDQSRNQRIKRGEKKTKTPIWFLEDQENQSILAKLIKKLAEKTQIMNIKNERGNWGIIL